MTDERLRFIAKQAAAMGKTELRRNGGSIKGILFSYHEEGGLRRMRSVEKLIEERAGEDWLNKGRAKELAFGIICAANWILPPDAAGLVCVVDKYEPTPVFLALTLDEQERIHRDDCKNPTYFLPHEALMASVQTPQRMCMYTQRIQGTLLVGEPDVDFCDQGEFDGRLKLFGEPPAEIMEALKL